MPECIVHPEISPLSEAVHDLVVLDAPEHEDDAGDDAEHEGVGEVFVHGQLHEVPPQPELACGGHQGGEHPPVRIMNVIRPWAWMDIILFLGEGEFLVIWGKNFSLKTNSNFFTAIWNRMGNMKSCQKCRQKKGEK